MSDGTIQGPMGQQKTAGGAAKKGKGGRPRLVLTEENLERMCQALRKDGVAESKAALLVDFTAEMLRRWKKKHPAGARRLARAKAEFQRERMEIIREASSKEKGADWRAQAWLLEHTQAVEEAEAKLAAAAALPAAKKKGGQRRMRFDQVLTPEHLEELQKRRMAALRAAEQGEKRKGAL